MSVKVVDESVSVTSEPVRVESEAVPATVKTTDKATAIVSSQDYIVTTSAAAGYANGGMPDWLTKSIDIALSNGYADQNQVVHDLSVLIAGIEKGVHESISSIENQVVSQNIKIDTVKSELDGNAAAIVDVKNSYVTKNEAVTVDTVIQSSEFNANNASILNQSKTIATDAIAASYASTVLLSIVTDPTTGVASNAGHISTAYTAVGINPDGTMNASSGFYGDYVAKVGKLSTRIASEEGVSSGAVHVVTLDEFNGTGNYDGITYVPKIGSNKQSATSSGAPDTSGVYWEYIGGSFGTDGWHQIPSIPTGVSNWTGGASKILYDTNGNKTGWGFYDGSSYGATGSVFAIYADNFYIQNGDGANGKPFSVDVNGNVNFIGKVTFNGMSGALSGTEYDNATLSADLANPTGTTVIDGGRIETGLIADPTGANFFNMETGQIKMDDSVNSFILDSAAAGTNAAPNIQGGYIKASNNGMYIDLDNGEIYIP